MGKGLDGFFSFSFSLFLVGFFFLCVCGFWFCFLFFSPSPKIVFPPRHKLYITILGGFWSVLQGS